MSKANPDCKGCRGSGFALGQENLGKCACTKRYAYASVRISLHIPGVGIDGHCQDIPLKSFEALGDSFTYIHYEPTD